MKTIRKRTFLLLLLVITALQFGCNSRIEQKKKVSISPKVDIEKLQQDFKKWWTYQSHYINLSADFVGLGVQSDTLTKARFLNTLTEGSYIPVRLATDGDTETYQLTRIATSADYGISENIVDEAKTRLKHFRMEGNSFPDFELTDLEGNVYTSENTAGKTLIIKTWFIGCSTCVKEFPELNEMVAQKEDQEDVLFISLAEDQSGELRSFLQKKPFSYKVIADQSNLIRKQLKLQSYPTHIVVGKDGKILKVVNKASELFHFLESRQVAQRGDIPPPQPV